MRTEDQVVEKFNMTLVRAVVPIGAPMIMVYNAPLDYPDQYVARLYNGMSPTHLIALADTLEDLRGAKPDCMGVIQRTDRDPLKVVETWL